MGSCVNMLMPQSNIFQNKGGYPSTETCSPFPEEKLSPTYALHDRKFFFPTKGFSCEVRKVAWIIPSCGRPLTLGLLSCSSSSTPSPKMLGSLKGFFRALSMQLQNKEASWCMNLIAEIQPAAPS